MKKDEEKLWDAFFACGLYLYLEKTGELDKEKLWHETRKRQNDTGSSSSSV